MRALHLLSAVLLIHRSAWMHSSTSGVSAQVLQQLQCGAAVALISDAGKAPPHLQHGTAAENGLFGPHRCQSLTAAHPDDPCTSCNLAVFRLQALR